ncbi:MAG TPA: MgtC/SapB family protein [Bacillales bacterium]|nr:MgtC/SapB family protein [Bacillales bacterium]
MLGLPEDAWVMTIRLFVAAVLSGVIGLEREVKQHPAGFRTHLLVGVGACLMMLLSIYGFQEFIEENENARLDPARLPAYVVSGIGFLGAGTILVHGVTVKGLTTAASIWVVAGIGLVVGNGMFFEAVLTTIIVVLSLLFLNKFEKTWIGRASAERLNVVVRNKAVELSTVVNLVEKQNIEVHKILVEDYPNHRELDLIKYTLVVSYPERKLTPKIYDDLYSVDYIYKVYTTD